MLSPDTARKIKLPEEYSSWSIAEKGVFWEKQPRTPEQQAFRERLKQIPEDWKDWVCKKHQDSPLVLTILPDFRYCPLCLTAKPYKDLVKKEASSGEKDS